MVVFVSGLRFQISSSTSSREGTLIPGCLFNSKVVRKINDSITVGCKVRILSEGEILERYPDYDPDIELNVDGTDITPDMAEFFGQEGIVEQFDPGDNTARVDCAFGWWPTELLVFISEPDDSLFFGFKAGDIVEMKSVDEMRSEYDLDEIWWVSPMEQYCGMEFTIKKIQPYDRVKAEVWIEHEGVEVIDFSFNTTMFNHVEQITPPDEDSWFNLISGGD